MIISIANETDLGGIQVFLNIPQKKRTVAYTLRILADHYRAHVELEVQINKSLLRQQYSYLMNPSQLAKNVNAGAFANASGHTRGQIIVVLLTNENPPENFWTQALKAVEEGGTHSFNLDFVPKTYRNTPSLLKYRLQEATGKKVRILKNATLYKVISSRPKSA